MRKMNIRENMYVQFRGEFFNVLNHADFGRPSRTLSSSTFGEVFGTRNSPRIGQVALKFVF